MSNVQLANATLARALASELPVADIATFMRALFPGCVLVCRL